MNTTFTKEEFLEQVGHFRGLMTSKSFMESEEEKKDVAVKALAFAYLSPDPKMTKEDTETCKSIFSMTMDEYNRRCTMLVMLPLKKFLGIKG